MSQRKIVHIDMDAGYVSVEQRDDPQLRGKPVIAAWAGQRSVVCAVSHELRCFGVRSAIRATRFVPECGFRPCGLFALSRGLPAGAPGMSLLMATGAQGNEVQLGIVTTLAPRADVVNLKIESRSAVLAAPTVALEYLAPQLLIGSWAEFQPWPLGMRLIHELACTCSKISAFCGSGRNPMSRLSEKRRALESPFSRLAPAMKSAQIISKQ